MKKISVISVILIAILALSFTSAFTQKLNIQTGGMGHRLSVHILNPQQDKDLVTLTDQDVDNNGLLSATFSTMEPVGVISIIDKKQDADGVWRIQSTKEIDNQALNQDIFIDLTKTDAPAAPIINTSVNTTAPVINTTVIVNTTPAPVIPAPVTTPATTSTNSTGKNLFSGFSVIFKNESGGVRLVWPIIGGALILGLVLFFVFRKRSFKEETAETEEELKEIKDEIKQLPRSGVKDKATSQIEDAEKKLQEAQEEIGKIKNREEKMKDAKKRLDEARINWENVKSEF